MNIVGIKIKWQNIQKRFCFILKGIDISNQFKWNSLLRLIKIDKSLKNGSLKCNNAITLLVTKFHQFKDQILINR